MLGRILKVEKKVKRSVVKEPYLSACECLETKKPVSFSVVFGMQS